MRLAALYWHVTCSAIVESGRIMDTRGIRSDVVGLRAPPRELASGRILIGPGRRQNRFQSKVLQTAIDQVSSARCRPEIRGFSAGDPNVNLQDVINLQKANLTFQQMVQVPVARHRLSGHHI